MPTSNHDYNTPSKGTQDWHNPLNANFSTLDTDIEIRDTDANRSNYTAKDGAKFLATDTGVVYVGDGNNWTAILAIARYDDAGSGDPGSVTIGDPTNTVSSGLAGAVIAGGSGNEVEAKFGNINGGDSNAVRGFGSTIGGGVDNEMFASGALYSVIAGGGANKSFGRYGAIGGGQNNTTGMDNNSRDPGFGTVSGGEGNTASGAYAAIPGGRANTASGDYSFAAGRNANARNAGSFVWADGGSDILQSTDSNQFLVQGSGGVSFFSVSSGPTGVTLAPGSGSWSSISSRTVKEDIERVEPEAVLEKVRELDTATWSYEQQADDVRHMGPTAETFHAAFGLGDDRKRIASVDADGVAFAAIQGLADRLEEETDRLGETVSAQADRTETQADRIETLEAENERLREEVETLKTDNEAMRERLAALEERVDSREGKESPASPEPADD